MADTPTQTRTNAPETAILALPPLVHVIVGFILLGVWIVASIMSMQTTEAWLLGITDPTIRPDLTILAQFPRFFDGSLPPKTMTAFVFAFSIQCVLLTSKIGLAVVHARMGHKHSVPLTEAVAKSARNRAGVWNFLSIATLLLNAIADAVYSAEFGFFQAVAFCGVLFLVTYYLGTFGIQNISAGMSRMNQ